MLENSTLRAFKIISDNTSPENKFNFSKSKKQRQKTPAITDRDSKAKQARNHYLSQRSSLSSLKINLSLGKPASLDKRLKSIRISLLSSL